MLYSLLLDPGPASHVNEVLSTDDIVGEAGYQRGRSGCCRDLLSYGHLYQVLQAIHQLQARSHTLPRKVVFDRLAGEAW